MEVNGSHRNRRQLLSSEWEDHVVVLVVDDDRDRASLTARRLEEETDEIKPIVESNPERALDRIRTEGVDCVIGDYMMAGVDGLELLAEIRENDTDLPFILYTGKGSEEVASEAFSRGANEYVRKDPRSNEYELLATRIHHLVAERRSAQQLRESHRRFSKLIEQSPVVIRTMDEDGIFTYVSPSASFVLGYEPEELKWENGFEYIHPDDRSRVQDAVYRLMDSTDDVHSVEYRYLHGDDEEWHWVHSQGRNLLHEPSVEAFVINTEDITERKVYEQELERQNDRLDEFASVVSHDLRNPLNVIMGHVELAREDNDPQHLDRIESAVERMEALIDDTLTLARQGETVGETEAVDLGRVATRTWDQMDHGESSLRIPGEPGLVLADKDRLSQALLNLFTNAVEHGDEPTIELGTLDDGFYVQDDGPGFPEDVGEKVFDRGFTTSDDGTGFGLSIVKSIVEAHGWSVAASEGADGGARFEIAGIDMPRE